MSNTVKKFSLLAFISLCFVNFAYMSDMVIIPAADLIEKAFKDVPQVLISFIISGPQLLASVAAILATIWMRKFHKKKILVVIFAIFCAASCLGAAVENVYYVAFMRAIVGFCGGTCSPVALSLINDFYHDDEYRYSVYVGYFQSVGTLMAMVMSIVSGIVCVGGWKNAYMVYYAAIPMLALIALFVPDSNSVDVAHSTESKESKEHMPWVAMSGIIVAVLIASVAANIMAYLCAIYVADSGLGDSAFAGLMSGCMTLATSVSCFFFAKLYNALKRFISVLIWGLTGVAYLLFIIAVNPAVAIGGKVVLGFAYGLLMSYYCVYVGDIVPASQVSTAIAIIMGTIGLGAFLSSYVAYFMMQLLNTTSLVSVFPFILALMMIMMIIELMIALKKKGTKQTC